MSSASSQAQGHSESDGKVNLQLLPCGNIGIFDIGGKDAPSFLHRQLSQEIRNLQTGQGASTCFLNKEGRILLYFDLWKTAEGYQAILFESQKEQFFPLLDRVLFAEDVRITDKTSQKACWILFGEGVPAWFHRLTGGADCQPRSFHVMQAESSAMSLFVMDWLVVPSLLLVMDGETPQVDPFFENLSIEQADWEQFHALRVEKGTPWPEFEVDETMIPYECGLENAISVTKGCYVGQEIISRIHHLGKPPRMLRGLLIEGHDIPLRHQPVQDSKGTEVGKILSACWSERLQSVIATSSIRAKACLPGTTLAVAGKTAQVAVFPF